MPWLWLVVMLLALAWPASSLAQDVTLQQPNPAPPQPEGTPDIANVPGKEEARRLDPVVVTATMVATPQEQLGATVTVVTGDEITQYNYDRLEDVFRQVPGVQVQTTGSPGKATSLSIRGGGSQRSIVLIDGLRTASPTLGTDIAEITIDRSTASRSSGAMTSTAPTPSPGGEYHHEERAGAAQRQRVGGGATTNLP
jgi:outer membrane cobalamin receptor